MIFLDDLEENQKPEQPEQAPKPTPEEPPTPEPEKVEGPEKKEGPAEPTTSSRETQGNEPVGEVTEEVKLRTQGPNPLHVKLSIYDGPLDLLLDLIKKNEMDIYDIPIAEITKQYLDYLGKMKQLDLEIAGEFIVMAATLIYIKSKMLLPTDGLDEDEDGVDPRAELVQKLLDYQAYKEAAKELGALEEERGKVFTSQITDYYLSNMDPAEAGVDTFSANLYDLLSAFKNVLTRAGRKNLHEVFEEIISIEEKMAEIQSLLTEKRRILFFDLFNEQWSRNELIATFLALLELVRSKTIRIRQDGQFGDIVIERIGEVVS